MINVNVENEHMGINNSIYAVWPLRKIKARESITSYNLDKVDP